MYYAFGVGIVTTETVIPALLPSVGTGASGSAVALYPIFLTKGVYLNPLANLLVCFQANITVGVQIAFTYYGSTKLYMPINNTSMPSVVRGSVAASCYLMRDE
jgi:ABC-type amino acid transport system permease subunit